MPRARILRSAIRDLDDIWFYIARDSVEAAERMVGRIEAAAQSLSSLPGMGRRCEQFGSGLRSYPVGNYIVFYRRVRGGIEVVHVYRGARNFDELFGVGG